jgi:hypothetical protein
MKDGPGGNLDMNLSVGKDEILKGRPMCCFQEPSLLGLTAAILDFEMMVNA